MADEIISKYEIDTKEAKASLVDVVNRLNKLDQEFKNATKSAQTLRTSGFNPLSNSINQFARELPNAAISAQVFFTSISNQVGQLQDAINQLIAKNKDLAAQGLKTQSILKQVVFSIFSVGTAIQLGVTALVLYSKEIGNFISSLFESRKAIDIAIGRFTALSEALASKEVKTAITNITELRTNIELAQRGLLDKKQVLDQYNATFGKTAGSARSLDEAEKELVKNGPAFINMTIAKAAAQITAQKIAETEVKQRQLLLDRERSIVKQTIALAREEGNQIANINRGSFKISAERARAIELEIRARFAKKRLELTDEEINEEIAILEQSKQDQLKILQDFQTQAAQISVKTGLNIFGVDRFNLAGEVLKEIEGNNITATFPVNFEPELRGFDQLEKFVKLKSEELTDWELLDAFVKASNDGETQITAFLAAEIAVRAKARDKAYKEDEEKKKQSDKEIKELEKIKQEGIQDLLEQFAKGAFDVASNNARALADEDIRILEEKKEKELENEKLTKEQRAAIEKTFDEQRAQILNKNAKTQRDLDLAQIVVTTALAVIRQFATGDPFSAALRANLAAAEGALQFAIAAAQPLPKFNKGTDRVRGGIPGRDSVLAALTPDEAVIPAQENMKYPGMSKAWVSGQLDQFLAMKYLGPALEEMNKKNVITINNDNSKLTSSSFSDKKLVRTMEESNLINKMIYREIKKTGGFGGRSNRKLWN